MSTTAQKIEIPAGARTLAGSRLAALAIAIARREGYGVAGSVPARLNNPGDLMYAHQLAAKPHPITGADGKTRSYAEFPTALAGWVALFAQIRLDAGRGLTLAQFIAKYAPAADANDPASYLAYVMREIGTQNPAALLKDLIADSAN